MAASAPLAHRLACELACARLRDAIVARDSYCGFGAGLEATVAACLPSELRSLGHTHSKVLGVASALDGSYAAFYAVDAAKLAAGHFGYGRDLRFSTGSPGAWRCPSANDYEWRGDWDVRTRPWLARCAGDGGWSRPYADPAGAKR